MFSTAFKWLLECSKASKTRTPAGRSRPRSFCSRSIHGASEVDGPRQARSEAVFDYVAIDSIFYAHRFVRQLVAATRKLESFPKCGRPLPELQHLDLREVVYSGYRMIYRIHF